MKNQWIEKRKNKNAKKTENLTLLNLFSIEGLCNDSESNELSICSGEIELKTEDENFLIAFLCLELERCTERLS
jgi:hypothetical protein